MKFSISNLFLPKKKPKDVARESINTIVTGIFDIFRESVFGGQYGGNAKLLGPQLSGTISAPSLISISNYLNMTDPERYNFFIFLV